MHRFLKLLIVLNNKEECLVANGFLVEAIEASLGTEEELKVYLSLDDLHKIDMMIIQMMQGHKVEMEASPLHMLMVECAKDIEEFAWVLSEGVAVRSASSESI